MVIEKTTQLFTCVVEGYHSDINVSWTLDDKPIYHNTPFVSIENVTLGYSKLTSKILLELANLSSIDNRIVLVCLVQAHRQVSEFKEANKRLVIEQLKFGMFDIINFSCIEYL